MLRAILASGVAAIVMFGLVPSVRADSWGCSYEKCLAACQKAGAKYCSAYCDTALKDKQRSKVCK